MSDEKKKISAWVSCYLLERVLLAGYQNYTDAVVTGLKLIVDQTLISHNQTGSDYSKSVELAQARATLEGIEKLCEEKNERTRELQEQIKVKDEQLRGKDSQLEQLTETMQAQAIHLQTLINQKAIEAPGAKRPWWRFW
jgi:CRISPR/Cas system-associated endonuclease Cas3-HD